MATVMTTAADGLAGGIHAGARMEYGAGATTVRRDASTGAVEGAGDGVGASARGGGLRVLLYSHDTYGLGHIRRSRAIAMALAEAFDGASMMIVTGSPIVGRFDFPEGVDFVRVPGVVKLPSGRYATHNLNLDIDETTALREQMILATTRSFAPDVVIVDKEPAGFRGEMIPSLELLRARGARVILGVRDVLDEPEALAAEWERKNALAAVTAYYDELWVYGLREVYDPFKGLDLPTAVRDRVRFTGYLRREAPDWPSPAVPQPDREPFVLITAGGGGDGDWLMDWALTAYEADPTLNIPAVMVFGPFMKAERRREFERRVAWLSMIEPISFDSRLERLMADAMGVVAMGGYNTFCEILSFDRPAVIAPRTSPRLEQYIRACAAERLGLTRTLPTTGLEEGGRDPMAMAHAIRALPHQNKPSAARIPGLLDGLESVVSLLSEPAARRRAGS